MNEAFIWLSRHRFIDNKKLLMARNIFWIFTQSKPVRGLRKKNNIPGVNWLKALAFFPIKAYPQKQLMAAFLFCILNFLIFFH